MPTSYLDNPAGRLLSLFEKGNAILATDHARPGDLLSLYGRIFELPRPSNDRELFHRLFELEDLVNELNERILSIDNEEERDEFMVPMPRIRAAIMMAEAVGTGSHVFQAVTPGDLIVLRFCSRYLHNYQPEAVADPAELEKLDSDVAAFFNAIHTSTTIERELKDFLLDQIETLRRGIAEYRIGGIERLIETLGSVLGASVVHRDLVKNAAETDEGKRFTQAVNQLASIIQLAWKTTKVIEAAQTILPMLK